MSGYSFEVLSKMGVEELAVIQSASAFAHLDRGTQENVGFFTQVWAIRADLLAHEKPDPATGIPVIHPACCLSYRELRHALKLEFAALKEGEQETHASPRDGKTQTTLRAAFSALRSLVGFGAASQEDKTQCLAAAQPEMSAIELNRAKDKYLKAAAKEVVDTQRAKRRLAQTAPVFDARTPRHSQGAVPA